MKRPFVASTLQHAIGALVLSVCQPVSALADEQQSTDIGELTFTGSMPPPGTADIGTLTFTGSTLPPGTVNIGALTFSGTGVATATVDIGALSFTGVEGVLVPDDEDEALFGVQRLQGEWLCVLEGGVEWRIRFGTDGRYANTITVQSAPDFELRLAGSYYATATDADDYMLRWTLEEQTPPPSDPARIGVEEITTFQLPDNDQMSLSGIEGLDGPLECERVD